MIGNIFNRWTVVSEAETNKSKKYYNCVCQCGNTKVVAGFSLKLGESRMCDECKFSTKYDEKNDLGKTFGKWTVVVRVKNGKPGRYYECICECGTKSIIAGTDLHAGRTTQCTSCQYKKLYNTEREINKKYGKWTVLRFVDVYKRSQRYECVCECGFVGIYAASDLRGGRTLQCATCHNKEIAENNTKHGMWNMPLYKVWVSMLQRCRNPKDKNYHRYGGRGIGVCNKWLKFDGFLEDMGYRPENMTIERIDNDGNYTKENCKWVSHKENCQNRSTSLKNRTFQLQIK